jgi:hypothetical protein
MPYITLKDILISARQESHRMRHYYLGVEHIFVALLEVRGGIASSILESYGLQTNYVIDAIRRKIGKGGRHRLWAGTPNTPRADIILDIAHEIALESGRNTIHERDLLIAILEEAENIPTRVLTVLGLDFDSLKSEIKTRQASNQQVQTFVSIEIDPDADLSLTKEQSYILRRIFHGYARIRIEQQLQGGYTPSSLFVVTPIQTDNRKNSTVVVKVGPTDVILDEAHRYERYVKSTLPPLTARIEDTPTAPEASDLAGLKYAFITGSDEKPHNLRSIIGTWQPDKLSQWLRHNIFEVFGNTWWKQTSLYRFEVWREYDWLLPPILTLDIVTEKKSTAQIHKLKPPIKRSHLKDYELGEIVGVENFIVQKTDKDKQTIQLAVGHGTDAAHAYKIEVRSIDFQKNAHYRGEILDLIVGRVWQTRDEQLMSAVRALEPNFDVTSDSISNTDMKIPNPIFAYQDLMEMTIEGSLCTIHGDLHLGNILMGPSNNGLLIDFAQTRDGHTIFDWATLEMSLLVDYILPKIGSDSWGTIWQVAHYLQHINFNKDLPLVNPTLNNAITVIQENRRIVQECLYKEDNWSEYYVALALACLRAMTWKTMSLAGRRIMYLTSGLAIQTFQHRQLDLEDNDKTVSDTTDHISNY